MDQSTMSKEANVAAGTTKAPVYPWGDTSEVEFYRVKRVEVRQSFFKTSRGVKLYTRTWVPLDYPKPKALICMVHGYANDISWTFQNTALLFTEMGYAAVASDLDGHGRTEGLHGYLPNVDGAAQDCVDFFNSVTETEEFKGIPKFIYGESLGGAIALMIHFLQPEKWNGMITAAAMCKLTDDVRPNWVMQQLLLVLAYLFPTWAITPTNEYLEKSIRDDRKRELARQNPQRYNGKPRLGTAAELLRVTDVLSRKLQDVNIPMLIIHGTGDTVTDPAVSQELYDKAKSQDKTLKMYDGMSHVLFQGEPDDNVAIIVKDMTSWLRERVEKWHSAHPSS